MNLKSKTQVQLGLGLAKLLATALIKRNGKISLTQIEALPMVETNREVREIIDYLERTLHVERIAVKTDDRPVLRWDTIFVLSD